MTAATIDPALTMGELLQAFPSARRALFKGYHLGGCASCGFQEQETLAELCARSGNLPVDEVVQAIEASEQTDRQMQLSPAEAAALLAEDRAQLVDIRTREEFDAVHIEGATFFTQELMRELPGWDREKLIVFVDHQGQRSMDAAAYFTGHGMENVRALRGGIDAWSTDLDPSLPRYDLEKA